jgi:hypothetical protein
MMKKNLVAASVAAILAVPFAAQAGSHEGSTSIKFSGDARVRYHSSDTKGVQNTMMQRAGQAGMFKNDEWDSRVRLNINGSDGKVANVKAQIVFSNGKAGLADDNISIDHAYATFNLGPVMLQGGKMISNWGHKLYINDNRSEGVKLYKMIGDINVGLAITQPAEDQDGGRALAPPGCAAPAANPFAVLAPTADCNDDDTTKTTIYAKMGDMAGLRIDRVKNDMTNTSGTNFDLYAGAPLPGGWALGFEYAREAAATSRMDNVLNGARAASNAQAGTTGTAFALSTNASNPTGWVIAAMGKAGPADLTIFVAQGKNGFQTDDDFFTFVGTGGENGAGSVVSMGGNYGQESGTFGFGRLGTTKDTGFGVIANMEVMPTVDLQVGFGRISGSESVAMPTLTSQTGDLTVNVLSLRATKNLSKKTSATLELGNFSGDFKNTIYGAVLQTAF